jgi:hypothetical protein
LAYVQPAPLQVTCGLMRGRVITVWVKVWVFAR